MRSVVIGLGSMGCRRIRLIRELNPDFEIIGVDLVASRRAQAVDSLGIEAAESVDSALRTDCDCAFLCTSPASHASLMAKLIDWDIPVFSEINLLSTGYERLIPIERDRKLFLSSTFLYRKDLQHVINRVNGNPANYVYHSGQYLPDWHPWESYKNFFVSKKETSGCREILAIEMPWLIRCFGAVRSVQVVSGRLSSLDLPYPDNYLAIVEHEGGSRGLLAVDVVARKAARRLEVFSENLELNWDGRPDSLREYDIETKRERSVRVYEQAEHDDRYSVNIIEDAYRDEVEAFFRWVIEDDASGVKYGYGQDWESLKVIDELERQ